MVVMSLVLVVIGEADVLPVNDGFANLLLETTVDDWGSWMLPRVLGCVVVSTLVVTEGRLMGRTVEVVLGMAGVNPVPRFVAKLEVILTFDT